MPKVDNFPDTLKPYRFHGLVINYREGYKDATADCMFCNGEGKFGIKVESGEYRCVKCAKFGNARTFLYRLHELSEENTTDYSSLAEDRGLLYPETLAEWKICKSILDGNWLIPAYNDEGKFVQLYSYRIPPGETKRRAIPTPTFNHQMFRPGEFSVDSDKEVIHLLEGPWDGIAWYEMLRRIKSEEGVLSLTANQQSAIWMDEDVIAIPGAGTFPEKWVPLFADKEVILWCQNDHVRTNEEGKIIPAASYEGMRRIAGLLLNSETPPIDVKYLFWGENGYREDLKHGYDIRDCLIDAGNSPQARLECSVALLNRVSRLPDGFAGNMSSSGKKAGKRDELALLKCSEWGVLVNAWRKALKWIEGLDIALSTMLASITSTMAVGDQLWIQIISPPSTGKSELCEALSTNKKYVLAKSTIRGFHSGFGLDDQDHSLISAVAGKTLVVKDGDTLLQSPNLGQILSEARDIYDTVSRTHYRTGKANNYEGVRMTWILCGTSSLLSLDSSELGERFLKCIIMDGIDDELEDEILLRKAYSSARNVSKEVGKDATSKAEPEILHARALTGGYVDYLRHNAIDLLSSVSISEEDIYICTRFGKFVAYMRARPSKLQEEHSEREFGSRLVSQIVRLAMCTAVVLNKTSVDKEVMRRVKKVTMDTSRGVVLNLMHWLYFNEDGGNSSAIATAIHRGDVEVGRILRFLRHIGAVEPYVPDTPGVRSNRMWRMTDRVRNLIREVVSYGRTVSSKNGKAD